MAEYQYKYKDKTDELEKEIGNRKFEYDVNDDELYKTYEQIYTKNGQRAMQDTMAKASAMTGGYGNSYAATAGQQVYDGYMEALDAKIPELEALALEKYNAEGTELKEKYDFYKGLETEGYNSWLAQQASTSPSLARSLGIDTSELYNVGGNAQFINGGDESGAFHKAISQGKVKEKGENKGKIAWLINDKTYYFDEGVNPYNGKTNKDIENGVFSNGYQPDNVGGKKLKKTGEKVFVNGVEQSVWTDGKNNWVWDGLANEYVNYDEIQWSE